MTVLLDTNDDGRMMESAADQRTDQTQKAAPEKETENNLSIRGRFWRYNSPFLQLIAPVLTTRYIWLALEDINPLNVFGKPPPELKPDFKLWEKPGFFKSIQRNFAALSTGATALAFIAYYSKNTYNDMRTLYAESIGYELDKKPEDVTPHDIFVKSQNEALKVTRAAYLKRTLARAAAGGAFVFPWHVFRDFDHAAPKYDANVNAGVGALALCFSWESFIRKPSFFDKEQSLVDTAINGSGFDASNAVEGKNVQNLLILQRQHLDPNYVRPKHGSMEGQEEAVLCSRIADLMNQTYTNIPKTEPANFTVGKFNYLVGFGLLEDHATAMSYVEMANRSKDMKDVKAVAAAIKNGENAKAVFQRYGIDIDHPTSEKSICIEQTPAATQFASKLEPAKTKLPTAPRTAYDFAAQAGEATRSITP